MKKTLLSGLLALTLCSGAWAQIQETPMPKLVQEKGKYAFYVDDKPFFVLGGQCHNSSNWPSTLPKVWETMAEMNANTLEIPIYWECVEPVEGQFDFSSVQLLLDQARQRNMKLILLWFATWKNGSNHYMPAWMKLNSKTYYNVVGKGGKLVDSPSAHCEAAMKADAKAFTQFMKYLKENDPCHTVIMVQVQNEPGTWDSVRDYSQSVDKLFNQPVPSALLKPEIFSQLETKAKKGTWSEVFGDRADEYFNAWHIASYIEYVAAAGKAVNPLPMFVNVALRAPFGNPPATNYESGGATDNVIGIYKAAAPHIDFVAPDIYQNGDADYMESIKLYTRKDNALMVPETHANSTKYLYEVISRGIGFSPFGVDGRPAGPLALEYKELLPITDKLTQWRLEDRIFTAIEPEDHQSQRLDLGEWEAILSFGKAVRSNTQGASTAHEDSSDGHAMIVKLNANEFYCMGSNVRFSFLPQGKNKGRAWHYLKVEEGSFNEKGEWVPSRILNGDETDWTGPYVGAKPQILHISVYVREPRK